MSGGGAGSLAELRLAAASHVSWVTLAPRTCSGSHLGSWSRAWLEKDARFPNCHQLPQANSHEEPTELLARPGCRY